MLCAVLGACALANAAAGVAAWHRYQLLGALPGGQAPDGGEALLRAEMWFGNLTGWRNAAVVVSVVLFIAWLMSMRRIADEVWPEGQRRNPAWLILGWLIPVVNLFVPKMFVNDLWAGGLQARSRKRGHPLLTLWWIAVLVAFGTSGATLDRARGTAHVAEVRDRLWQVVQSDGFFVIAAALSIAVVWRLSTMLEGAERPALSQA
ncbi:DUF4328 domain-containing protein [Streptomyces sp. NPDC058691]|uniref:DUF4328 domain-containing protein n=1 Tax=Streptomyces sp. NPDC058691 TaxID=3346601 RepID=UPI0036496A4D